MNRLYLLTFRSANHIADFFLFSVAFLAASALVCRAVSLNQFGELGHCCDGPAQLFLWLAFYGVNFFTLAYVGAYHSSRLRTFEQVAILYGKSSLLGLLIVELIDSSYPYVDAAWLQLPIASSLSLVLLIGKEILFRLLLRNFRRRGKYVKKALLVARTIAPFEAIRQQCEDDPLIGLHIFGVVGPTPEEGGLGHSDELGRLIDENGIGAVVCLADEVSDAELGQILHACEERGVQILLKFEILNRYLSRSSLSTLGGENYLSLKGDTPESASLLLKFLLDKLLSAVLLVVFFPLLLGIALLIRFTSKGPIFFRQLRAGQDGQPFVCLKFRSMELGAEERMSELLQFNEMEGPVFKMKDDPRVTRLGRFLRRTSLDELPQLWNVLAGQMSLVGPRPLPVREAQRMSAWHRRRLRMKPGITGPWQVAGRSEITDFDRWAELDLDYINNWSLALDFRLLLQTVLVVLRRRGAY